MWKQFEICDQFPVEMAVRKQRDVFLATCLLESIEDENYRLI